MTRTTLPLTTAVFLVLCTSPAWAADGNRLVHLDEPNNPWQFQRESAKLITPQWIGEKGVHGVVVLAIDDMSGDGQHFRNYLGPIIDRLKLIDGRGPVSITCNRPDPIHPNMQWLLGQGVSLETHTMSHPCPLLHRLDFARAAADYHRCVDLLASIPNNRPVGFRFPCMDGQNTPSPRAYAEILNGVSDAGNFMSSSTSVGIVFTPADPELPRSIFDDDPAGGRRFAKYLMTGFVNYIEDYPYPFTVGNLIWEVPFVYPNDYTGQALHGAQNPITISDFKAAVDATVAKKGAVSLCFHAGGWIRNSQMVEIVDHSARTHGKKVKFLTMREMDERMVKNMLAGHPLRDGKGKDNGVRIFDIDGDGYMDVVIGNAKTKLSRIWDPKKESWHEVPFPTLVTPGLRFGVLDESGRAAAIETNERGVSRAWRFDGKAWVADQALVVGLAGVTTLSKGRDGGVRLRDLDGDGVCELIVGAPAQSAVYHRAGGSWVKLPFGLPEGTSIVTESGGDAGLRFADLDDDGQQDVIFSNAEHYGTWMFDSFKTGWSRSGLGGKRQGDGVAEQHPRERNVLAPIVRKDGTNNGAWVKRGHLYWQNEDTGAIMPHHIDQRSFSDLLGELVNRPRSPKSSLRAMQARPGFRIELVAAEPLVMDPVDVAWGPDGRMWVAEMADYPMGLDHKGKPGSRIVVLTDTAGDGAYDKRTVFAGGLETANTVLPWRDGVLAVAPPNIWFMRDTNGDGSADEKTILYEGFGRGNEQHRGNGLVWGLDGWVYVSNGDSGGTIRSTRSGKKLELGGFDLRIKPDTGELERASGVTQHGRNRDDWGNWVAGNNSNGWQIALEDHDIRRNPKVSQPPVRHALTGVIDLYPISRVLSHYSGYNAPPAGSPGKLTSACGYTFYRDSLFDGLVEPSIYFSCPVHNCVHREVITWNGVLMQTARASDEARSEFVRSSDSWFRPTGIRTGPDGGMYVADMYRLVIEHPEWIDDKLEREMIADGRLRAGHDRGRIYKVFPTGAKLHKPARLAGRKPAELAAALDSPNGWQRDTAHMMMTWLARGEQQKAIPALVKVLRSKHPAARAQATSALADLGALSAMAMKIGLDDSHPGVRRNALRVGAHVLNNDAALGQQAVSLLDDEDAHVQRQAAYALGAWKDPRAGQALGRFLVKNAERPYLRAAALTSAGAFPDEVLLAVLGMNRTPVTSALSTELMGMLGEDAKKFVPRVLARIAAKPANGQHYEAWKLIAATRLLEAVGEDASVRAKVAPMLAGARAIVDDGQAELANRLAAVQLVERAAANPDDDVDRLAGLMKLTTPIELQVAATKSLLRHDDAGTARRLLAGWSEHGPAVRGAMIDALLARPKLTGLLLDAIAKNSELAASLDVSRQQLLLRHDNESIRKRATELLGGATSPDRAAVIVKYTPALAKAGDRMKGWALFSTHCAACHRLEGVGKVVGPNLAALNNRAPATFLTAILDPNQAIEATWMLFIAKTKDGRTLAGAVAEETSSAITLVGIDGSRTKIPRVQLASLESAGRSLMPEGLEAAISIDQMADLLTYLKSTGRPMPQVVVKGNTIEHLDTEHDGFYSITFDPVPGATGFELEWANEGNFKHWTIREIEAYANFESKLDIVAGKVIPGPVRTVNNVFANAFDGDVETFTYITQPSTTTSPQRTLLNLEPGGHMLDRLRINHVAGNDTNGPLSQITVRVTTDASPDLVARKYVDVANLSVQIFGETAVEE
jgi:putative membrane-bound dehydrogenase-like protein